MFIKVFDRGLDCYRFLTYEGVFALASRCVSYSEALSFVLNLEGDYRLSRGERLIPFKREEPCIE